MTGGSIRTGLVRVPMELETELQVCVCVCVFRTSGRRKGNLRFTLICEGFYRATCRGRWGIIWREHWGVGGKLSVTFICSLCYVFFSID